MTEFTRKKSQDSFVTLVINTQIAIKAPFVVGVRVQSHRDKTELVGNNTGLVTAPQLLEAGLPYSCLTELCA